MVSIVKRKANLTAAAKAQPAPEVQDTQNVYLARKLSEVQHRLVNMQEAYYQSDAKCNQQHATIQQQQADIKSHVRHRSVHMALDLVIFATLVYLTYFK